MCIMKKHSVMKFAGGISKLLEVFTSTSEKLDLAEGSTVIWVKGRVSISPC